MASIDNPPNEFQVISIHFTSTVDGRQLKFIEIAIKVIILSYLWCDVSHEQSDGASTRER